MNDPIKPTREERAEAARATFVQTFGCQGDEIAALAGVLSEAGLRDLSLTLQQIRAAPVRLRSTMALSIPFVLANDNVPADQTSPALAAAKAIIARFPEALPAGSDEPSTLPA
jgi:hypothetical protein